MEFGRPGSGWDWVSRGTQTAAKQDGWKGARSEERGQHAGSKDWGFEIEIEVQIGVSRSKLRSQTKVS